MNLAHARHCWSVVWMGRKRLVLLLVLTGLGWWRVHVHYVCRYSVVINFAKLPVTHDFIPNSCQWETAAQ